MRCRDVMTMDPVCCVPDDTAVRIAKIMKTQDVGSVPICESHDSKKLVGIVTDRDLALQVIAEGRDANAVKAQQVMTQQPVSCRPEDDLQQAIDAMESHQVRRIPVVDDARRLVGIIAVADIATRTREHDKTAEVVEEVSKPAAHAA